MALLTDLNERKQIQKRLKRKELQNLEDDPKWEGMKQEGGDDNVSQVTDLWEGGH